MIAPLRLIILGFNIQTEVGMEWFLSLEFITMDVSLIFTLLVMCVCTRNYSVL